MVFTGWCSQGDVHGVIDIHGGDVRGEIGVHGEIGVFLGEGRCFNRDYAVLIGRSGMVLLRGDAWVGFQVHAAAD